MQIDMARVSRASPLVRALRPLRASAILVVAGLVICAPPSAHATAIGSSAIGFVGLVIDPASGDLVFVDGDGDGSPDPWTLHVFAEASDTVSVPVSAGFSVPGPGNVGVVASVTYAEGIGVATDPAPPEPALDVSASASSAVNIAGCETIHGLAAGRGGVSHSFMITGGTGSVLVDFGATVSGLLDVVTDHCGLLAQTEVFFGMELDGDPILFSHLLRSVGPNDHQTLPFAETLRTTRMLEFDTPYFIHIEVDSESEAITVPEPPVAALWLLGFAGALLAGRVRLTWRAGAAARN